jgi:NADP-dependent 3-hydroxy acid dehydrogenase YdfG
MGEQADLTGRTAVVTGASSGIGRAVAVSLAGAGATVVLGGRTATALQDAVKEIEQAGGRAIGVTLDVRDPAQVRDLVDRAVRETGRLDVMVNNAGLSYPGAIADQDPDEWREMFETNVIALLVGCQAAICAMRACGAAGHVVNVSSVAARSDASGVYGATKAAVNHLATTLRKELEDDPIRVVNVMPGAVATNFARNFPPAVVEAIAKSMGIDAEFRPGEHLPREVIEAIPERAPEMFASADDIARAVLFAVSQPSQLNVFEIVVRPQRQLSM